MHLLSNGTTNIDLGKISSRKKNPHIIFKALKVHQ